MRSRDARSLPVMALALLGALLPLRLLADDIDIFLGSTGSAASAPNIIFLIDNGPNWSRNSQQWPDNGGNQGAAELAAVSSVLNSVTSSQPLNIGLAMLSSYAGSGATGTPGVGGGYIRFGARDVSIAANRTALQTILNGISADINGPTEKLTGQASKDEDAAFYEIYKYLSGLAPYSGPYGSSYAAQNQWVDVSGNPNTLSGAGQGLTSGFAISGGVYQSPLSTSKPCARTYIIYIANNAQGGAYGSPGQSAYQSAIANVSPALYATTLDTWTDEWTRFLFNNGVVVPAGNNNGSVVTYILDAWSAQDNVGYSASLRSAATQGGGKYYQVGTQAAIIAALSTIFSEIQAVNSTFASASLPISATNRAQNDNEVFIPMFRPDPNAAPRWMGNLKRYQIVGITGGVELDDYSSPTIAATNLLTGFVTPCALSFDTTDSGTYWSNVPENPAPKGTCATTSLSPYSDAPDGPFVEKGGVAEVIREGNNPPTTSTTPTWAVNRNVYTLSGLTSTTLTAFNTTSTGLSQTLVNYMMGHDVMDENGNGNITEVRPSLHGDVIHSRPLPIDYGATTGVTVYYGANDGTLRAVNAGTGSELWAFIAPEFYTPAPVVTAGAETGFARLQDNTPQISYYGMPGAITPTPVPKNYYFDGTIGSYQSTGNSNVWIYPTMRRGGRTVYALNVTTPTSPTVLWKVGCPNLTNNTGCTSGMNGMGQSWSMPSVAATVAGYSSPVVIMGGGYDSCEDANTATPSCSSETGAAVYVLDASSGAVLKTFPTLRSVPADVALISIATAGVVDHAYAVDTGGNIYRIDFGSSTAAWVMNRVAYTNGSGRKFLYAPALVELSGGHVYVAVGSGDREHPLQSQYPYSSVVNRFYVYADNLASTAATNMDDITQFADYTSYTSGTSCSSTGVLPTSTLKGWFMNLNQNGQGEQTVTSAIVASGLVAFSTNRPVPASATSCSTSLGEARGYWVNLFTGSGGIGVSGAACGGQRSSTFLGGAFPPSPVLATVTVTVPASVSSSGIAIPASTRTESIAVGVVSTTVLGPNSVIGPTQLPKTVIPTRKQIYWKSSGEN